MLQTDARSAEPGHPPWTGEKGQPAPTGVTPPTAGDPPAPDPKDSLRASTRRKSAAIALAVVGVASLSLAAAAQLNVNSSALGAATAVVASCQPADDGVAPAEPAITVGYTNGCVVAKKAYATSAVALTGVATACNGQTVNITLAGASGTALATATGSAVTGGATSYALSVAVDPKLITDVAVVISN